MEQYIVALITAVVGAVAVAARQWLQTKVKPQQFNSIMSFANDVVAGAEQAGASLGWDGPAKFEYAQTSLESLAKRVGINLKPEESNAIIHSAVKAIKDVTAYQQNTTDAVFQRGVEHGVNTLLDQIQTAQQNAPEPISDMVTEIVPSGPVGTVPS
jgi:hypothetical protein